MAPLIEEFGEVRRQLRLQNWNVPELEARANDLAARIKAELEAIEPVERALKAFHKRYWQSRIDELLGDGITVERVVQAHKIRWNVFGDRTPLENFVAAYLPRMIVAAMNASPSVDEVPLDPPSAEALDDVREIRAGVYFG
ncbi:MAG TPA: hypothetical protein VF203_15120 [Burkholderiales bacterium]